MINLDDITYANAELRFLAPPQFSGNPLRRACLQSTSGVSPFDREIGFNPITNKPAYGYGGYWNDFISTSAVQNANYVYYVAPNFDNTAPYFSTIQNAINACPSGGACVINVYAGVYSGLAISSKTVTIIANGLVYINVSASSPATIYNSPLTTLNGNIWILNSASGGVVYPNPTALSSYVLDVYNSVLKADVHWIEGVRFRGSNAFLKSIVMRNALIVDSSTNCFFDIYKLGESYDAIIPVTVNSDKTTINTNFANANITNDGGELNLSFNEARTGGSFFVKTMSNTGYTKISNGKIIRDSAYSGSGFGASSLIWAGGTGHKTTVSNVKIHVNASGDTTTPIWVENQSTKVRLDNVQILQENSTMSYWTSTNAGTATIQTTNVIANKLNNPSLSYVGQTPINNSNLWV